MKPCQSAGVPQFDFWLGDWNVESPASPGSVSRNQITSINGGCTIRESYTTPIGYEGTSLNFYDAARKVWHQTWIDNQGGALYLEGGLQGKAMVLSTTTDPKAVNRITWTPLDDGRVRQHWEATADGGKTWTTIFDGYYRDALTRRAIDRQPVEAGLARDLGQRLEVERLHDVAVHAQVVVCRRRPSPPATKS